MEPYTKAKHSGRGKFRTQGKRIETPYGTPIIASKKERLEVKNANRSRKKGVRQEAKKRLKSIIMNPHSGMFNDNVD